MGKDERDAKQEARKEERDARQEARQEGRTDPAPPDLGRPGRPDLGQPGAPGEDPKVDMLFDYIPKQSPYPEQWTPKLPEGGADYDATRTLTFGWRTPPEGIVDEGDGGKVGFVTQSDNNDDWRIEFPIDCRDAEMQTKEIRGPGSLHVSFGPNQGEPGGDWSKTQVPMKPDTFYMGRLSGRWGGYTLGVSLQAR